MDPNSLPNPQIPAADTENARFNQLERTLEQFQVFLSLDLKLFLF